MKTKGVKVLVKLLLVVVVLGLFVPVTAQAADGARIEKLEAALKVAHEKFQKAQKALKAAQETLQRAREVGYRPVLAEALFWAGKVHMGLDHF